MNWIVPGPNAKVLAQAIHCLAKLGEDLYIEGHNDKLTFRTVNLPKTAFASFHFRQNFFSFFPTVHCEEELRCQISMKAALVVFRAPSCMDKTVESLAVCLPTMEDILQFRLKFKQGFIKTNKIQLLENEMLQAGYENESLPSQVVIEPKVLADLMSSFQSSEISWAVSHQGIQLRNFSEMVDDGSGLRSEVFVGKEDLLELKVEKPAELTFYITELRTVLVFAENINCPLAVSFSDCGKPMYFVVSNELLTAQVVLSTLGLSSTQSSIVSDHLEPHEVNNQSRFIGNNSQMDATGMLVTQNEGKKRIRIVRRDPVDLTKMPGYDVILAPDSCDESD